MTGLAAAMTSGATAYEAESAPGGLCRSFYLRPGSRRIHLRPPADGRAYRFEVAGGHWMFGADAALLRLIRSLARVKSYQRRAAVYFPDRRLFVPYPLQYNLAYLGKDVAARALREMCSPPSGPVSTLADWLLRSFGPTLTHLFFGPFHELYTAGLWTRVMQEDVQKSPLDPSLVAQGATSPTASVGYNPTFAYPSKGMDHLVGSLARRCSVKYGKRAVQLDVPRKEIQFADGSGARYDSLVSTLPLNEMVRLARLGSEEPPGLHTSVLVLNIGAVRGPACPEEHWVYVPRSESGFYRVGFYSNVDPGFLPAGDQERVCVYVERAFPAGNKPDAAQTEAFCTSVVRELREWGFIRDVEVVHPSWVEVAFTFSLPGSLWRSHCINLFERNDVLLAGRYATWRFQGMAECIRDGLVAGAAVRPWSIGKRCRL